MSEPGGALRPEGTGPADARRLVSCVVPVFDGERYLGEALESIFAQTHRPLEVVVVDDGSTDGTREVVEGYGERVRYLWQENQGPAAARNRGIEASGGEFLAFLDADDLWHPEKLERQLARFEARPELEACFAHYTEFLDAPPEDEGVGRRREAVAPQGLRGFATPTALLRRWVFSRMGSFDESLFIGENISWFLNAEERGLVYELMPDILVRRRIHRMNMTRVHSVEQRKWYLQFAKRVIERRRRTGVARPIAELLAAGAPPRNVDQ